ncbi:hypothetical protein ACCS53_38055, partial [Rhizobium ruizarguesonis]
VGPSSSGVNRPSPGRKPPARPLEQRRRHLVQARFRSPKPLRSDLSDFADGDEEPSAKRAFPAVRAALAIS